MDPLSHCPHCNKVAVRYPFSFCPACGESLTWPSEPVDDFEGGNCASCERGMHWSMQHCPWCGALGESTNWFNSGALAIKSIFTRFSRRDCAERNGKLLDVPYFLQWDRHTCAVKSIVMVAAFFGYEIGPDRARRFAGGRCDSAEEGGGHGLTNDKILKALRGIGLTVRALKEPGATLKQLTNAIDKGSPVIVSIHGSEPGDHAVVVVGYDDAHIYVNDPAVLRPDRILTERFRQMWAGDGLVVSGAVISDQ